MIIKQLFIKDFGIFRQQDLRNLHRGMIVIGGFNRAGKTTLLQILRNLGYGFPRGNSLPPPSRKYEVEAELQLSNGDLYNIYLKGYADPVVNCIEGKGGREEIYAIDSFTYQRLFTICLDELRNIPPGVDDTDKLKSILLGAGLDEIIQIPRLTAEFSKRAYSIGCKYGKPDVGSFKPYYRQIVEGNKLRKRALNQVDKYNENKQVLAGLREEINKLANEVLPELQKKQTILDVVKNNYRTYSKYKQIDLQLAENEAGKLIDKYSGRSLNREQAEGLKNELDRVEREYQKRLTRFRRTLDCKHPGKIKRKLLNRREEIIENSRQMSGIKEKINNYLDRFSEHGDEERKLIVRMKQINETWEQLDDIKKVNTDRLNRSSVENDIVNFEELKNKIKEKNNEIGEIKNQLEHFESQLADIKQEEEMNGSGKILYLSSVITAGGILLSFIYKIPGLLAGAAGLTGFTFYLVNKIFLRNKTKSLYEKIRIRTEKISGKLKQKKEERRQLINERETLEKKINGYRKRLGVPEEVSPAVIKSYFREVYQLKNDLRQWEQASRKLQQEWRNIKEDLTFFAENVNQFSELFIDEIKFDRLKLNNFKKELRQESDKLFFRLKELKEYLTLARQLDEVEENLHVLRKKIYNLIENTDQEQNLQAGLNEFIDRCRRLENLRQLKSRREMLRAQIRQSLTTDRVKNALLSRNRNDNRDREQLFVIFADILAQYTSQDEVKRKYRECNRQIKELKKELERKKRREQTLENKLQELASTDKMEEAQRKIAAARAELKPLAEEYAVNRAAEFILTELRKRFMARTEDKLMHKASDIFSEITAGEYSRILPPEDLEEIDFRTDRENGRKKESTGLMSRGTREQLFLALRIGRIREFKQNLPVIIDDSLVNFDNYHLHKTVEILSELAGSHQIFIMTCHPHLVASVINRCGKAQFWQLERGELKNTSGDKLLEYLVVD